MMTQYVLYDGPADFPGEFIVREFEISVGAAYWVRRRGEIKPKGIFSFTKTLGEAFAVMEPLKLIFVPRMDEDEPCILGVWL